MTGEEKRFTQVFMPYKKIGPAAKANRACVVSLDVEDGAARLGVYVTRPRTVEVRLLHEGTCLFEQTAELSPASSLTETVDCSAQASNGSTEPIRPQALTLEVRSESGELLLAHTPIPSDTPDLPEPYYEEALRRDPGDSRSAIAMGRLCYQRGAFEEAARYFRTATERLTLRNPSPYDTESFYQLGLARRCRSGSLRTGLRAGSDGRPRLLRARPALQAVRRSVRGAAGKAGSAHGPGRGARRPDG